MRHELDDLDVVAPVRFERLELFVREGDELIAGVLVALDDLVLVEHLAVGGRDVLLLDAHAVARIEHIETDLLRRSRGVQLHGNGHESERNDARGNARAAIALSHFPAELRDLSLPSFGIVTWSITRDEEFDETKRAKAARAPKTAREAWRRSSAYRRQARSGAAPTSRSRLNGLAAPAAHERARSSCTCTTRDAVTGTCASRSAAP